MISDVRPPRARSHVTSEGGGSVGPGLYLDVAAEERASVIRQPALHRRAQSPHCGDRSDAECEAKQHHAQPAHPAAQFPRGQSQRQDHDATAPASSPMRPSAMRRIRPHRPASAGSWVTSNRAVPCSARRRNNSSITAEPVS